MEIIAHRGASFHAPENSLDAYSQAMAQGADRIELDVQLTRDGVPVVIHDLSTGRETGVDLAVSRSTFLEISALRLSNGERIPSFDEVCAFVRGRVSLDVELKPQSPAAVAPVIETLRRHGITGSTWITSFHIPPLRAARDAGFRGRTGLIVGSRSYLVTQRAFEAWPFRGLEAARATDLVIHHALAHRWLVGSLRARGLGLSLWSAIEDESRPPEDRAALYRRMAARRPDGIILGRVREARAVLGLAR